MIKKGIFLNILAGCLLFSSMNLFTMEEPKQPEQPISLAELTGEPREKIIQNLASEWIENNPSSAKNLVHELCESFGPGLAREIASEIAKQAVIVANIDVDGTVSVTIAPRDETTNHQFAPIEIIVTPRQRYFIQLPHELKSNWQTGFYTKISAKVMNTIDPIAGSVQLLLNSKSRIKVKQGYHKVNITREGSPIGLMRIRRNLFRESCRPYPNPAYHSSCLGPMS